ncbi:MAG: helix-turn-helix domain-containing protein [Alphaproteobacteria bacterium]|nr:helix-turn-helix domain-containing protein [Alphaproteobacteria bacterium]
MTKPLLVAIPIFPHLQSLDAIGPGQVFGSANQMLGREAYRIRLVATKAGAVATTAGFPLLAERTGAVAPRSVDTLIVPGGDDQGIRDALADKALRKWIAETAKHARRACSVCSGAFLLAATGMLKGKRVATHWSATDDLQRNFPDVDVDPEAIYIHEGKCWTSAGVTTGIDMALALVEEDFGRDLAMAVARQLVVYMRRPGHQTQFSSTLVAQSTKDSRLADLASWAERNIDKRLDVETLAEHAHMSLRSFHRHCHAELGISPAKFVEGLRLDAARRLLETRSFDLAQVAARAGFSGSDHLIRAFERRFGVTPGVYREMHATQAAE